MSSVQGPVKKKIIPYNKISILRKLTNKKKVLVGGCFDIFHYGHLVFLEKAKKEGDFLIIALESDEFIGSKKKRIPIHHQRQRSEILANLAIVDSVILLPTMNKEDQYWQMVRIIKPNIIAVTAGDPQIENKRMQAKSIGGKLLIVTNLIKGYSTQKIINYARFSGH